MNNYFRNIQKYSTEVTDFPSNLKVREAVQTVREHLADAQPDSFDIFEALFTDDDTPTGCYDALSKSKKPMVEKSELLTHLTDCSKILALVYTFPLFIELCVNTKFMSAPPFSFSKSLDSSIRKNLSKLVGHKNRLLQGTLQYGSAPHLRNDYFSDGVYIRTPVRVWDRKGRALSRVPEQLVGDQHIVTGCVNVYVLMQRKTGDVFVLFRGVSNDFNAHLQYGTNMCNIHVFRKPTYDIHARKLHKNKKPTTKHLFLFYYHELVEEVLKPISTVLNRFHQIMKPNNKIYVCGHSMGGALAYTFVYKALHQKLAKWASMLHLRVFACPSFANTPTVLFLEKWALRSSTPYRIVDITNSGDVVDLPYMFGDLSTQSLKKSISRLFAQLSHSNNYYTNIWASDPFHALLLFAVDQQVENPTPDTGATKPGYRALQKQNWYTPELHHIYKKKIAIVRCVDSELPNFAKKHSLFLGVDFTSSWGYLRTYEDRYHTYCIHNNILPTTTVAYAYGPIGSDLIPTITKTTLPPFSSLLKTTRI